MKSVEMKQESIALETIETHICEAALSISEKNLIPHQILDRISSSILDKIREKITSNPHFIKKRPLLLNKDDVRSMGDNLTVGNASSYQSWLHRDCFNRLIYLLSSDGTLKCPYFNIPQQIKRLLIIHIDHEILKSVNYVIAIRRELLKLTLDVDLRKSDKEKEYLCSFLASAMLFEKMLLPALGKALSQLKFRDISLSPMSLNVKLNPDDMRDDAAFFRYFMFAPTSNYFMRLILYRLKNHETKNGYDKNGEVWPFYYLGEKNISYIFKNWTHEQLQGLGFDVMEGISIKTFSKVSMLLSVLSSTEGNLSEEPWPPFLLSILSKEVSSDSVAQEYFMHCPDAITSKCGPGKKETFLDNSVDLSESSISFRKALNAIKTIVRTPLRRQNRADVISSNRKKKRKVISELKLLKDQISSTFGPAAAENIIFYIDWLDLLFSQAKLSVKSISNYAKDAEELLLIAPDDKPLRVLNPEELLALLQQTLAKYESPNIMKGLKSFLDFLETATAGSFKSPNWRTNALRKDELRSQKPLVFPEQVKLAIDNMGQFFFRHLGRYVNTKAYVKSYRIAAHKSEIIYHLVMLAYYAGLRIMEFANLLVGNVIYDDGVVLCVRSTKTKNGVRNIPLSMLLPEWYLEEFLIYWKRRKSSAINSDRLFPWHNGGPIDQSYLTTEITRLFESVGVPGITAHILRHSFANWFLLRWFFCFRPEYVSDEIPFLSYDLFSGPSITRFKGLFPIECRAEGGSPVQHALAVLARLIGHGGPIVTMERYIHVGDWLFYFLSKGRDEKQLSITSRQAADLLQVSHQTLPKALKGKKKKNLIYREILSYQLGECKKCFEWVKFRG
ncbi:MAG: tyrosine-type recombinase/integrase [Nitrospiraceae bacterium]|nr:tyrosine-type recombinase/integrase [Nitrospiraceae bacterium]